MNENEEILDAPETEGPGEEKLSTALTIVSFCFPIVGAIIYFTNRKTQPKKAQSACNAALIGFLLGVILRMVTMASGLD